MVYDILQGKSNYNHSFKNIKIDNISAPPPQKKLTKEIKSKTRTRYEPETHRLLAYPQLTDLRWTVSHFVKIKTTNEKSVSFFICIKEVSYSPLMIKQ